MSVDTDDPFLDPAGPKTMLVSLCLGLALGLVPLVSQAAMVPEASGDQAPEPPSQPQCQSASECLREAETKQNAGDPAGAGQAHRKAFEALRADKKPANEGARIAMFCANIYRLAFDADGNIAHLDAANEVLELWRTLAGPDSKASLGASVETELKQLEEVRAPLKNAEAARLVGDRTLEAERLTEAIAAMVAQQRPQSALAPLISRLAEADIAAFDEHRAEAKVDENDLQKLEATKSMLEEWRKQRPADDDSEVGSLIDQSLVEIQARIDEATIALTTPPDGPRNDTVVDTPPPPPPPPLPPKRVTAIALLTTGGVVTVAGAAMLGEGIAFTSVARRRSDAEEAKADELQQQYGSSYPRDEFDADLQRYRDEARVRNIGFIAGGAVLLAGGLASGIAGAVLLRKKSRPKGSSAREKLVLIPTVSRSQLQLSLTTRF